MKFLFKNYLLVVLCVIVACQNLSNRNQANEDADNTREMPAPNTLSENEKAEGWELLFDGKSTDKFKGYNQTGFPAKGWKAEDGMLVVMKSGTEETGFGGDIITRERYENFEFTVEFMLTDTANSGIFYMVDEAEGTPIWHNAPEYQILDDATYATMGITDLHFTAANYDLHPAKSDYKKPMGEWNTARILKNKGHVEHWLNGQKVVEYDLWSPEWEILVKASKFKDYPGYGRTKNGHIGIQDHGHEVKFRNIKIRRL